ncbi:MAG: serine phosphatase [Acidobacteria bacterium]|nr:serine phosphatase [Acidobacteriota bacterium]
MTSNDSVPVSRSLAGRLVAWIVLVGGAAAFGTALYSNVLAVRTVVADAEREARSVADAAIGDVELVLRAIERATQVRADVIASAELGEAQIDELLRASVEGHAVAFGAAVAFAPYAVDPQREHVAFYRYRDRGTSASSDLAAPAYRYWEKPWYTAPATTGKAAWTAVYFDEGGGGRWMVTYAVPAFRRGPAGRQLAAVVTTDVTLEWLHGLVASVKLGESGYAMILSREGRILAHPDERLVRAQLDAPGRAVRRETARALEAMVAGRKGFEPLDDPWLDQRVRVAYGPIEGSNWSLAVVYPQRELLGSARNLFVTQLLLLGLGLLLLALVVWGLVRRITRPLVALTASAARLGAGELDAALPAAQSRDEIGTLTAAFSRMRDALKDYVRDLEATTRAKERYETELGTARRVQEAMLPPREATGAGWDLAASLTPARTVGGDLYAHFERDGRIWFLVADVSGKGVPAALFMARAKTMFEVTAARSDDPSEILRALNRGLGKDNDAGMFVTAVAGSLAPESGELLLAIAGHEAPVIVDATGTARQPALEGGPILGLLPIDAFPLQRLVLAPGETLVGFTDGVTEAEDPQGGFFGMERVLPALTGRPFASAGAARDALVEAVRLFVAGGEASDDLTVLALHRAPGPGRPA